MKWIYGVGAAALLAVWLWASRGMDAQILLGNGGVTTGLGRLTPITLFLDAAPTPKLAMFACVMIMIGASMIGPIGLVMALARQAMAARIIAIALGAAGAMAAALGALGWVYGEQLTRAAMAATHVTNPMVIAPSRAESLLSLTFGAFAGFVLLTGALVICLVSLARPSRPAP